MPVTTNTRKLAALLGASGAGIGTDGLLQAAAVDANVATQAELDAVSTTVSANETDADKTQTNLAILAFKQAVNNDLVKYSLKDQIIDEYETEAGIDTGVSAATRVYQSGVSYSGGGTNVAAGGSGGAATVGDYKVHTYYLAQTGNAFTPTSVFDIDILVVAGGGGGGSSAGGHAAGGGGAGGVLEFTSITIAATGYTITVGAGGAGGINSPAAQGTSGGNSSTTITGATSAAVGGGGGGRSGNSGGANAGLSGGSGGGGGSSDDGSAHAGGTGTAGPPRQGYNGGVSGPSNQGLAGTGGGWTAAGADATGNSTTVAGGAGGNNNYRTGSNELYSQGGGVGGNHENSNSGVYGRGGSGRGALEGSASGHDANDGIVVIRYLAAAVGDLTLQSLDTAAETEADYADMVMLIEDAAGTATINTDIKGFISEDSGVTFTEGVLVDEGDWGTNKRILAFHDLDISAQSGTAMCYKITTHNQAVGKQTKIHATSIGWK